jgi:hypothetical protein
MRFLSTTLNGDNFLMEKGVKNGDNFFVGLPAEFLKTGFRNIAA